MSAETIRTLRIFSANMNSIMTAATAFPAQVQEASLTVYQLTVAGILAAAIVGIVLGIMTYMSQSQSRYRAGGGQAVGGKAGWRRQVS